MEHIWNIAADTARIEAVKGALAQNGFSVEIAKDREDAKRIVLALIPKGAEVMTMTSVTVDELGIAKELNGSGHYDSVRAKFATMDRATQGGEMQKMGAAPEWTIGSVHAVTKDGHVLIASATGSQLPSYAYGSAHVVWVVGAQKIVKDTAEGLARIYEYVLPLESERAKKAYGAPGSSVNKILIMNKEGTPGRITIIFVPETIGF